MKKLNGMEERKIFQSGYRCIAGIDEAGRGSLAGPVIAAAVRFDPDIKLIKGIDDSKKVPPRMREIFYKLLVKNFEFAVGMVDREIIDEINIFQAGKLAMLNAANNLPTPPDYLFIDAFKINHPAMQNNIIKGDQKIWCIAAASIIAKVTRDKLMVEMADKYPNYGFERHKGYGTAFHLEALKKFGICDMHRRSYEPIKSIIKSR